MAWSSGGWLIDELLLLHKSTSIGGDDTLDGLRANNRPRHSTEHFEMSALASPRDTLRHTPRDNRSPTRKETTKLWVIHFADEHDGSGRISFGTEALTPPCKDLQDFVVDSCGYKYQGKDTLVNKELRSKSVRRLWLKNNYDERWARKKLDT